MKRTIITIDEEKCNGCGICVSACHEGAIGLVDGKAKLLRDDYCDGMGDCLPECPTGAITFEEREALAYDEAAVVAAKMAAAKLETSKYEMPSGCPGSRARTFDKPAAESATANDPNQSELRQWPVEIKLVSPNSSYFDGASVLIAADCTAYAYGDFHRDFIKDRVTLIGCPKLDGVDYAEKLTAIFSAHDIRDITVARMEVPCCGGLEMAVQRAVQASEKDIPLHVTTISIDGGILS